MKYPPLIPSGGRSSPLLISQTRSRQPLAPVRGCSLLHNVNYAQARKLPVPNSLRGPAAGRRPAGDAAG